MWVAKDTTAFELATTYVLSSKKGYTDAKRNEVRSQAVALTGYQENFIISNVKSRERIDIVVQHF